MKRNFIKPAVMVTLLAMIFTACQIDADKADMVPSPIIQVNSLKTLTSNPEFLKIYKEMEAKFNANYRTSGAEFILPLFTYDGFSISQNLVESTELVCPYPEYPDYCYYPIIAGQSAWFETELGPKDFSRKNPDGTVTVHINSKTAYSGYFDIESGAFLSGANAKLNMSYTGPVEKIDVYDAGGSGEIVFTYYYIDLMGENSRAISFFGSGIVQQDNTSPFKTLAGRWIANPGRTQEKIDITLK